MKCIFSGNDTNTEEHLIPQWLQRRFDLWNQEYYLPNNTTIKYRNLKIPAEDVANQKFGEIEKNISEGIFNLDEVYLWAHKIHLGCIVRDSTLRLNIQVPDSPFMCDITALGEDIWLFQKHFDVWRKKGTTTPSPFGSVFIIDSFNEKPSFEFFHCFSSGTIGIDIGEKFILVFLWDQGDAVHLNILDDLNQVFLPRLAAYRGSDEYEYKKFMTLRIWLAESAYKVYFHRRPMSLVASDTRLIATPPLGPRTIGRGSIEELQQICHTFSIEAVVDEGGKTVGYQPYESRI